MPDFILVFKSPLPSINNHSSCFMFTNCVVYLIQFFFFSVCIFIFKVYFFRQHWIYSCFFLKKKSNLTVSAFRLKYWFLCICCSYWNGFILVCYFAICLIFVSPGICSLVPFQLSFVLIVYFLKYSILFHFIGFLAICLYTTFSGCSRDYNMYLHYIHMYVICMHMHIFISLLRVNDLL